MNLNRLDIIPRTQKNGIWKRARLMLVASAAVLAATLAPAQTSLKPGPIEGRTLTFPNARNYAECEFNVGFGTGADMVLQIYNSTGTTGPGSGCPAETFAALDTKELAAELGASIIVLNPPAPTARKWWVMDELDIYAVGETFDFWGVKATWVAKIGAKDLEKGKEAMSVPYQPLTNQQLSKWVFKKGRLVFLLRAPEGKVYVMQTATNLVDKELTYDQLPQLGSRLKRLPEGWKYEVKTLTQDLVFDVRKATPAGLKHLTVDEYANAYLGCGFDAACNSVP